MCVGWDENTWRLNWLSTRSTIETSVESSRCRCRFKINFCQNILQNFDNGDLHFFEATFPHFRFAAFYQSHFAAFSHPLSLSVSLKVALSFCLCNFFKKIGPTPASFPFIFGLFKQTIQFLQQINANNVCPVYKVGIQSHDLSSMSYHQ